MSSPASLSTTVRRRAATVLAAFVAAICVTLFAPFVEAATATEPICSAHGERTVHVDRFEDANADASAAGHDHGAAHGDPDGGASHGGPGRLHDGSAHCPLCLPAGLPPLVVTGDFTPVQPLSQAGAVVVAALSVRSAGAPLPARGPPTFL